MGVEADRGPVYDIAHEDNGVAVPFSIKVFAKSHIALTRHRLVDITDYQISRHYFFPDKYSSISDFIAAKSSAPATMYTGIL